MELLSIEGLVIVWLSFLEMRQVTHAVPLHEKEIVFLRNMAKCESLSEWDQEACNEGYVFADDAAAAIAAMSGALDTAAAAATKKSAASLMPVLENPQSSQGICRVHDIMIGMRKSNAAYVHVRIIEHF